MGCGSCGKAPCRGPGSRRSCARRDIRLRTEKRLNGPPTRRKRRMRRSGSKSFVVLAVLGVLVACGLTGCDYWPPALQAQIEQLQAELQAANAEKARLEQQLADLTKVGSELQAKLDEMERQNQDLSTKLASLEQSLAEAREKLTKLAKPAGKAKPAAKAAAKSPAKAKKPATGTGKPTAKKPAARAQAKP